MKSPINKKSGFEDFILPEAFRRVVQVREHAILSRENFGFLGHGLAVVDVGVGLADVEQVADLGDPLQLVVAHLSIFELGGLREGR